VECGDAVPASADGHPGPTPVCQPPPDPPKAAPTGSPSLPDENPVTPVRNGSPQLPPESGPSPRTDEPVPETGRPGEGAGITASGRSVLGHAQGLEVVSFGARPAQRPVLLAPHAGP